MAKTRAEKEEELKELVTLISNYPVVGVVNIEKLPSAQFQQIRKKLRSKLELKVAKNILLDKALEEVKSKPGLSSLREYIQGQTALVTSSTSAFKLAKELGAMKLKMPAKGGENSPEDIIIKAGETKFTPGPIVGELQKAGIPASIERGKVIIRRDKTVVKKNEQISRELATALTRLDIFPLEVGLDLRAAYEDGTVFSSDVLSFDELKLKSGLLDARSKAFNLALNLSYPTPETVKLLIPKASAQALNLSISAGIVTQATIKFILQKAYLEALAIKSRTKEA